MGDGLTHFDGDGNAVMVDVSAKAETVHGAAVATFDITFSKSGKKAKWDGSHDSVLALAEEHGVKIDAGCRAGGCGSCLIAIKSGEVEYAGAPPDVEAGSCLSCICKPKGALVIDA